MSVAEIEKAIQQLPCPELCELRQWFDEYLADQWDGQIAADAKAGKLDYAASH